MNLDSGIQGDVDEQYILDYRQERVDGLRGRGAVMAEVLNILTGK